jgi:hypothetical protein
MTRCVENQVAGKLAREEGKVVEVGKESMERRWSWRRLSWPARAAAWAGVRVGGESSSISVLCSPKKILNDA